MIYGTIRVIFWIVVFKVAFVLFKKINPKKELKMDRKLFIVLTIILWMILVAVSGFLPVENLFVNFSSPQAVFSYYSSGEILSIKHGNNSSKVVSYSRHSNSYSYMIIPRAATGYKIPSMFSVRTIARKHDTYGIFTVYSVSQTDDYYVFAAIPAASFFEGDIYIFGSNTDEVKGVFRRIRNTNFFYAFVSGFQNDLFIIIDGKKIFLAN